MTIPLYLSQGGRKSSYRVLALLWGKYKRSNSYHNYFWKFEILKYKLATHLRGLRISILILR